MTSPFAGTAQYYQNFRAPYAPGALDFIANAYALDGRSRALDLGCGPGTLAIPLSSWVAEVVAVDPEQDMLAEARRQAAGRQNITWLQATAEDVSPALGTFRVVTLGQSFHWMDRDVVLRNLATVIEDGGGLAILNPGKRRPQESWEPIAAQVIKEFLGEQGRHPRANPNEPKHEPALLRSEHFSAFTSQEFPATITRDVGSILGCIYSWSSSTKAQFGIQSEAFEQALRDALLNLNPSGIFNERTETEVILAPMQTRARR